MPRKHKKKIPEGVFNAQIHALSHDGRGIASIDGKTTFISNALPGEDVDFEYTYSKASFDEGKAIDIKVASEDRATPKCAYFGICGGCSLQHIKPEIQIQYKQKTLLEQLQHFGNLAPKTVLAPVTGPHWAYRDKARLGARLVTKKGGVLVGFREKYGRYLADMNSCEVLCENIGTNITAFRELIGQMSCPDEIPQIEVAKAENETALIFRHLKPLTDNDHQLLNAFAKAHQLTIYLQPKKMSSIHQLNSDKGMDYLSYTLPDHQLEMLFHPTDFTQVNMTINRKMINLALELLDLNRDDHVLDLFCGLGNFTLPIARYAKSVIGVEGSEAMVERGTMNAQHNHIDNATFYSCDLTQDFTQETWAKAPFDKLLIDPPRSGALNVIENIAKLNPKRIVYVSCNPATLARDAGELVNKHGYTLEKAGVLDMFPHTAHVESIALFTHPSLRGTK